MQDIEAICFETTGPFGSFRVPATTRGFITFPVIPRTAAVGLIAAILGVERNEAYEEEHFLYRAKIAIQCLNDPKIIGFRTNLIQTKNVLKIKKATFYFPRNLKRGYRSPQTDVYLKEPKFRIFVQFEDSKKMAELSNRLKEKEYHYIPYYGRANLFCHPEYIGEVRLQECTSEKKTLCTIPEAVILDEIYQGSFTYVFSVPMNYKKSSDGLSLSRIANILHFKVDPTQESEKSGALVIKSEELACHTIKEGPDPMKWYIGKEVAFLPST